MRREAMEDDEDMEESRRGLRKGGSGGGGVLMVERIINWRQLSRPRGRRRHGTEGGRRPWGWDQSPPPGPTERQRPFGPPLAWVHDGAAPALQLPSSSARSPLSTTSRTLVLLPLAHLYSRLSCRVLDSILLGANGGRVELTKLRKPLP